MKHFFKELFEYGHDVNQKLQDVFTENPEKTSQKSIELYNHIINAHHIWNNRIEPKQSAYGIWEIHPMEDWENIGKRNYEHSLLILDTFDLDAQIDYTTTTGQVFNNSIRDVLFQIINHSTYHRAQIATEFRRIGLKPLLTDYIAYKR